MGSTCGTSTVIVARYACTTTSRIPWLSAPIDAADRRAVDGIFL